MDYFQVLSSAALDRQNFDIVAKVPPGATKEQFRAMLRNMLAERFGLKVHTESREFPAYQLVVAKGGPKFKEASSRDRQGAAPSNDGWPDLPATGTAMGTVNTIASGFLLVRLKVQEEPLSKFADLLYTANDLPVVDKTGLTGKYTFALEYTKDLPGQAPDAPPIAPALPTALNQQLGLLLVSKKLPFHVVVVDAFSKLPTEN